MSENFWRVCVGILVATLFTIRIYWQIHARTWERGSTHVGPVIYTQLGLTVPALFGLIGFLLFPEWVRWAAIPLSAAFRWVGLILITTCAGLLCWIQICLGENFSPMLRIRKKQRLVTWGAYGFVRHPMYSCILLLSFGLLLSTANLLVGFSWLVCTALVMVLRTPIEEDIMTERFGDDYRLYMQRVPRYLPRFRLEYYLQRGAIRRFTFARSIRLGR